MGYNSTYLVVTSDNGVSISDVQSALGVSTNTLAPTNRPPSNALDLCNHTSVKWFSKYKPTNYESNGFLPQTSAWGQYWRGKQITGLGMFVGCGLDVPYAQIPGTVYSSATSSVASTTLYNHLINNVGQYWILSWQPTWYTAAWSRNYVSQSRLLDFYLYTNKTPVYPKTGNTPFTVTCALPQSMGTNIIDASAQISYNHDDVSAGAGAVWLGTKSIFGCDSNGGGQFITIGGLKANRFFGVMVYDATTKYMILSREAITALDGDASTGVTGLDYVENVGMPNLSVVNQTDYFKSKDTVYAIPFILAYTGSNFVFFNLNNGRNAYFATTLRDTTPTLQVIHVNSIRIKLSYNYVSSRTFDFYVSANSDIVMSTTSVSGSYANNNKLYFALGYCQITPADQYGSATQVVSQSLGTNAAGQNDYNNFRYSSITGNTSYAEKILYQYGYNNFRSRITFASGAGTSGKVGLTISVYHRATTSSSSAMTTKNFNFTFTMPANATTNGTVEATVS